MFPWFTLLRHLTFMYFTQALIYFWCCFTMARIKKCEKKYKKNIDGQFTMLVDGKHVAKQSERGW